MTVEKFYELNLYKGFLFVVFLIAEMKIFFVLQVYMLYVLWRNQVGVPTYMPKV